MAKPLADAANQRIHDLMLANEIRHSRINGFEHRDNESLFAYQIENGTDVATGNKMIKVSLVIPIFGNPSLKAGDSVFGINNPPAFVKLAAVELERRQKVVEKNRQEREQKRKEAEAKKKAAADKAAEPKAIKDMSANEVADLLTESAIGISPDKEHEKNEQAVRELSATIKANPKLKVINRALSAFADKKPENLVPGLTAKQLDEIIRDAFEVEDIQPTPRSLRDLVEWSREWPIEDLNAIAGEFDASIKKLTKVAEKKVA